MLCGGPTAAAGRRTGGGADAGTARVRPLLLLMLPSFHTGQCGSRLEEKCRKACENFSTFIIIGWCNAGVCWINELLVRLLDNQIVKVRAVTPPRGCGLFRLADRDTPKKVLFRIDVSSGSDLLSILLSLKAGMQHLSQNSISALSCTMFHFLIQTF